MRKNRITNQQKEFSILALDDDQLMTETLQSYFQSAGYRVDIENDPLAAIERVRSQKYDILLLDFLMRPICGDEVVRQIREFDQDLFIILLTGHKSMAPPIKTIRELDIQGYYEKNERFDQLELLIESCTKSIRQMRVIQSYRDGLYRILDQTPVLNSQQNINEMMTMILDQMADLFQCHDGFVYFDLPSIQNQSFGNIQSADVLSFKGIGSFDGAKETAHQYFTKYVINSTKLVFVPEDNLLIAPLFANQRRRYGVLAARLTDSVKNEDQQLFEVYSKQVGSIVSNLLLRTLLQLQNQELSDTYATLRQNHIETINAMRQMVDAKDFYTRGHSDRVSYYAVRIARAMGKGDEYVERLRIAGLFHDIGKIGVPDEILRKDGPLTEEEYAQIKKHSALGKKILSSVTSFQDILPVIETHHERWDGKGYPLGISGADIPEQARIISVADAFDAMTSKRVYRDSLTLPQAIAELMREKDAQFDGHIVDVFLSILKDPEDLEKQLLETFTDAVTFKRG